MTKRRRSLPNALFVTVWCASSKMMVRMDGMNNCTEWVDFISYLFLILKSQTFLVSYI